jgi:hypothetical protein
LAGLEVKMRIVIRMLALAVAGITLGGCAAVVAGALIYDHTKSREDRRQFTEDFNRRNIEREKAGLAKLDWCSEVYKFSQSWAKEQPGCAERIARYENGDASALDI